MTANFWDRLLPNWRTREKSVHLSPDAEAKLVKELNSFTNAPAAARTDRPAIESEIDNLAIARMVSKKKGSWWQLPKDLKGG